MKKIFLFSLPFFVAWGLNAFNATTENLDSSRIADEVFNQIENSGQIGSLSDAQEGEVKAFLKTSIETQLSKVETGELSLDPHASNYFLLDTIKSGIDAVKKIASKITSTVVSIGKSVFNGIKGALGTVVNVGLKFVSFINDDFIKGVIGTAAGALGKALSTFGPLIADAAVAVPVVGPALAVAGNAILPFADQVLNKDNVEAAVSGIGMLADAFMITKDVIKEAASSNFAPRADAVLLAISKKGSSDEASDSQKIEGGKKLTKMCHNLMSYLSTLKADQYNKLSDKAKTVAAQCNHWANVINMQENK